LLTKQIALEQPLNPMQSFYFYRVDRLIKWGGWCAAFALEEHMKLSRVTVDFNRQADDFLRPPWTGIGWKWS